MKEQGWKYCPSESAPAYRHPIVHDSYLQYVSPMSFAAMVTISDEDYFSSHFCYRCGGLIVRSGPGQEIKQAISSHYATNRELFRYPGASVTELPK